MVDADSHKTDSTPEGRASGVGPIVEAWFLDVPYILDSLFRWTEFRANRAGVIDTHTPAHSYLPKPALLAPVFALYVVVSVFIVFGPTFDALCGLLGATGIHRLNIFVYWLLYAAMLAYGVAASIAVLSRMTRRLRLNRHNFNEGAPGMLQEIAATLRSAAEKVTRGTLGTMPASVLSPDVRENVVEQVMKLLPTLPYAVVSVGHGLSRPST